MAERQIGRRSFLGQVIGGAVLAGCAALCAEPAEAQRRRPRSRRMLVDADPSDPARPARTGQSTPPNIGRRFGRVGEQPQPLPSVASGGAGGGPRERWVVCPGHRRCPP